MGYFKDRIARGDWFNNAEDQFYELKDRGRFSIKEMDEVFVKAICSMTGKRYDDHVEKNGQPASYSEAQSLLHEISNDRIELMVAGGRLDFINVVQARKGAIEILDQISPESLGF